MNLNTTTQVDPAVAIYYDRILLQRGKPFLVHDRFGQTRPLKLRSGNTMKFRRYGSLAPATTPLVEGVTPSGKMVTKTDITATIKQYGDYVYYSDVVTLTNQDPVLTELNEVLGEQSGETLDLIYRDILVAGSNVYYAGSYASAAIDTRGEVNTAPTRADFQKIREIMVGNKAKMIAPAMKASTGQGTMPLPPAYFAIVSHELQNDLEEMSGWLPAHQYPGGMPSYPEEIGCLPDANIRFLITQHGKMYPDVGGASGVPGTYRSTSGSNCDVYVCLIFGKNAYGMIPLEGNSLKSIVKGLGSAGTADPLDQRGSAGWKAFTTGIILNDLFMIRGEFAATL